MKKVLLGLTAISMFAGANAQVKVGDNPTNVDASAVFEMESTNKGLLPPRMTTAQRNAISNPANGLVIFNTTSNSLEVNTGTPGTPAWTVYAPTNVYNADGTLTGNRTVTMNGNNLAFSGTGNVGIGTTAPGYRLDLGSSFGNSATDVAGKKLAVYNDNTTFYGLGISGGTLQFHAESSPSEAPGMVLNGDGNVGIGTTSPDASALLDVSSTTKGLLPPRMTTAQRNAISNPATGLQVYNTTTSQMEVNTGTPVAPSWQGIFGNNIYNTNGTLTGNRTVTMNGNNLAFSGTGNVGIGSTSLPAWAKLGVSGNIYQTGAANQYLVMESTANAAGQGSVVEFTEAGSQWGTVLRHSTGADASQAEGLHIEAMDNGSFAGNTIATFDQVNKRVGIGTATPTEKLEVNGNVEVNGSLTLPVVQVSSGVGYTIPPNAFFVHLLPGYTGAVDFTSMKVGQLVILYNSTGATRSLSPGYRNTTAGADQNTLAGGGLIFIIRKASTANAYDFVRID